MFLVQLTFIFHKVFDECFKITSVLVESEDTVIVIIRNDDIFRIASYINHLRVDKKTKFR